MLIEVAGISFILDNYSIAVFSFVGLIILTAIGVIIREVLKNKKGGK